jgi:hypothetical protein
MKDPPMGRLLDKILLVCRTKEDDAEPRITED